MNKAEKETLLRRTAPSRQKQAQEYLQGRSPGTMQRYAPDAHADPEQGWVELLIREEAAHVLFSLANSGPGIPPIDLPFIFERFFRTDRSRSRQAGGFGIGAAHGQFKILRDLFFFGHTALHRLRDAP